MGCSCDWQRTRFTLDETCARAVRETFFKLFKDGKIYRGKRLVNWDTYLQTAVSDDEVFHETVDGHFWYFKYPVVDPKLGEPTHVTVATTRPETMLGDTAVAVHPDPAAALDRAEYDLEMRKAFQPAGIQMELQEKIDDIRKRRKKLLPNLIVLRDMALAGRKVMLPLQNKEIPLVADEWAKPELGTGCVKITPAHDENDYAVWLRHKDNIDIVNIMNTDGTLNDNVPEEYRGLTMADARDKVLADLQKPDIDLVEKIEDRQIEIAHSDRSKTPIEPYLTDQWFVKMNELAQSAMDAVTDGRVKIIPERYGKGYLDWLGEKRDWPIGRQLWWGHRIPVWSLTLPNRNEDITITQRDFLAAFDEFAKAFDLVNDITVQNAENSNVNYYICARTDAAVNEINNFFIRHHRFKVTCVNDNEPLPFAPNLPFESPRYYADRALWDMIGYMAEQAQDVLDTWFSSALWPHSTMGWPEQTEELKYYYPTNVLITSRDIITLWVARMVLTGLYNVGKIPFNEVFIHPKILDGYGEGMSKSKGNGVDPLDVIDKFGADALRFGIAYLTTETQDIRMPVEFECPHCGKLMEQTKDNRVRPKLKCKECGKEFSTQWAEKPEHKALPRGAVVSDRFELARNFCNKLWNASRFAMMNLEGFTAGPVGDDELFVEDKWILSRLATVNKTVDEALKEYRYADAARVLYDFAWDEFCSFYVEMVKGRLQSDSQRTVAQRVLAHTLDTLLRLLHPMIPFLTEEVWQRLGEYAPRRTLGDHHPAAESVMIAPWPEFDEKRQNPEIEARFARFQEVLRAVRDIRSRQNVPPKTDLKFSVRCDAATAALIEPMEPYFASMAGAQAVAWGPDVNPPELSANVTLSGMEVVVDLAGLIDVAAEMARMKKEVEKLDGFIAAKEKKLSNANFVDRAPAEVVQKERESLADLQSQLAAAKEVLERLAKQ
jgi:valyl-tRNA synthetase